jgi:CRP/FNR family cyclic AMP-dependent transcriptional regulator
MNNVIFGQINEDIMLTEDIRKILLTSQPFKYLDTNELDALVSYCKITSFAAGDVIIQQGTPCGGMYIIIYGHAIVTIKVLGQNILNLDTINQGNFIGEVSLMEIGPSSASVIAGSDMQCLYFPAVFFDMLTLAFPIIKFKITKAITEEVCNRIHQLHKSIMNTMSNSDMITRSIFNDMIQSFSKPELTTFEKLQIDVAKLRKNDFFKLFTTEEQDEIFNYSEIINTQNHCTLIKEGDESPPYFLILRGAVQLNIIANNKVAKLAVLAPNTIFGSVSCIINQPSVINYMTCERANLLKISSKNMNEIKEKNILLWYKIFDTVCKSIVELEKSANKLQVRLKSETYNQ